MLLRVNPFATKTTPAPIAQPTLRTRASKAVQGRLTAIRESLACLCCIRPMQKKVVAQQSKISQVAGRALRFACAHKHKLIAAAVVGAAGATAYTLIANAPRQGTVPQKALDQVSFFFQKSLKGLVSNYFPHIISGGLAIFAANLLRDRISKYNQSHKETAVKETAVKETAVKETAVKETAVKETAVKETAVKETAVKETAVKE
ncbi:MAG: hypothetical protein RLZZ453_1235, partial [Chlamydiota bacterium]